MNAERFKCCSHCEKPCPPDGHTKPCRQCRGSQDGRRHLKPFETIKTTNR